MKRGTSRVDAVLSKFPHEVKLDLLHLHEPGGKLVEQIVHLLVEMPNLQFGFQVDLVVVFRALARRLRCLTAKRLNRVPKP